MDSADEKMHKKMQLMREAEAKEQSKKVQREIAKRKYDASYQPDKMKSISSTDYEPKAEVPGQSKPATLVHAGAVEANKPASWLDQETASPTAPMKRAPGKGMQLGKPKKQNELFKDLAKENLFHKLEPIEESKHEEEPEVAYNPLSENVVIEVEEKVNCIVTKDGDVEKFEVKGIIYLTVNDAKKNNPFV